MKAIKLRTSVLNLTMENWKKIDMITFDGFNIDVTPEGLLNLIGFDGGVFLSGKLNDAEREFCDEYYRLGRSLQSPSPEKN